MNKAKEFDVSRDTVGIDRSLRATLVPAQEDPAIPVDGMTFGVATMTENSPHDGEMHPDGDEILYLISGKVRVTLENEENQVLEMGPGDAMIVPQGIWHKVDILAPSTIVYVTPGPNNQHRPLESNHET